MKRPNPVTRAVFVSLLGLLSLASCSYFAAAPSGGGPVVTRVASTGSFDYTVDTGGDEKDVIFVFSAETGTSSIVDAPSLTRIRVDGMNLPAPRGPKTPALYGARATPGQRIADLNRATEFDYGASSARTRAELGVTAGAVCAVVVGDAETFSEDSYYVQVGFGAAHCRKVVGPIAVAADATPRTLAVWVSDSEWNTGAYPISQVMVDSLADQFLKAGEDNDIYDWLTTILGAEWGDTGRFNHIPHTGQIDIFLTDIGDDDSEEGGIVGFFYSRNNFTTYSDSNQRIMFVIDSVMFQNEADLDGSGDEDADWDADDDWPQEIYSTLAHEFQHMIHFYQKSYVAGGGHSADVWIDEMCSLLAEDLLAKRMGIPGPRGVSPSDPTAGGVNNIAGRIPIYNGNYYLNLVEEDGDDFDVRYYSTTYAFGAWAARNFGGAAFLQRVVQSEYTDNRAVERAAAAGGASPSDLDSLIAAWAVAIMGSDRTDMPRGYRYNRGDWFTSSIGAVAYQLGSIDFGNYRALIYDSDTDSFSYGSASGIRYFTPNDLRGGDLYSSSNVYYLAKAGLSGKRTFAVELPEGVTMHVVVK